MLISLKLDNISRNINGVLTGFSCTFIEENKDFISYTGTLYNVEVISVVDPETFFVTFLVGQLAMGIQIRMAKRARHKMLLVVHECCLRAQTENFCQLHVCVQTV